MRSQTLTKSHVKRTSFASMRHFPKSLSAEREIIRLKAIFQCPQNLRATCTKRRKNDFLPWRRDAEKPVFPRKWKPDSLKKRKTKRQRKRPTERHIKKPCGKHGISSIEKKAPKTKGSILSDSQRTRIHYSRPHPSRPANTPFPSARK